MQGPEILKDLKGLCACASVSHDQTKRAWEGWTHSFELESDVEIGLLAVSELANRLSFIGLNSNEAIGALAESWNPRGRPEDVNTIWSLHLKSC